MSNVPDHLSKLNIPDRISTLELSKLWIHKALQELEAKRNLNQPTKEKEEN